MQRVELKFQLSYEKYLTLKERLSVLLNKDREKYSVISQYFDTENLDCFYDKIEGELYHTKIRLRKYSDNLKDPSQPFFLEAKIKEDKWGMKHRQKIKDLSSAELSPYFNSIFTAKTLKPTCNVFYTREAFEDYFEGQKLRINFDTNLIFLPPNITDVSAFKNQNLQNYGLNFYAILEVKYSKEIIPEFIQKELKALDIRETSFSKYSNSALAMIKNIRGENIL